MTDVEVFGRKERTKRGEPEDVTFRLSSKI